MVGAGGIPSNEGMTRDRLMYINFLLFRTCLSGVSKRVLVSWRPEYAFAEPQLEAAVAALSYDEQLAFRCTCGVARGNIL